MPPFFNMMSAPIIYPLYGSAAFFPLAPAHDPNPAISPSAPTGGKRKRMHASDNDDDDMFEPFDELEARPLKKAKHRLGHKVRRAIESRVR